MTRKRKNLKYKKKKSPKVNLLVGEVRLLHLKTSENSRKGDQVQNTCYGSKATARRAHAWENRQGVRASVGLSTPGSRENSSAHLKKAWTGFDWTEDVTAFSQEGLTAQGKHGFGGKGCGQVRGCREAGASHRAAGDRASPQDERNCPPAQLRELITPTLVPLIGISWASVSLTRFIP